MVKFNVSPSFTAFNTSILNFLTSAIFSECVYEEPFSSSEAVSIVSSSGCINVKKNVSKFEKKMLEMKYKSKII